MNDARPPLQLGVLGCGRVFERYHLPAIARSPGINLRAASDTEPSRLSWARGQRVATALYDSAAELMSCPGLEAVLILTPPESHADAAVLALEAGLHVLVEKPMALNPHEAGRMVRAARLAQRRLQVGFNRRFREPYRRLRSRVRQLDPGEVRAMRFELAFPTASWRSRTDYLGDEARGGGVFDDVLSHQADLVCWLLGTGPEEVRAWPKAPNAALSAELKIGGLVARCEAAHASYVERIEIELANGRVLEASSSRMSTTATRFPAWRRRRALIGDRLALIGHRLLRRPNVTLASFERQLRDFEDAVRGGGFDGATAEEGALSVDIVAACKESSRRGGAWQLLGSTAIPAA
jgi:predicted dehydrogenase